LLRKELCQNSPQWIVTFVVKSLYPLIDTAANIRGARIHFRPANEDGLQAGISLGEWTGTHYLQPTAIARTTNSRRKLKRSLQVSKPLPGDTLKSC
jgi:hypothetical protein